MHYEPQLKLSCSTETTWYNTKQHTTKAALVSSNAYLFHEEQHILLQMAVPFFYLATAIEERVAKRGRPIFGDKLKA